MLIFGVGPNKTGTSSIHRACELMGLWSLHDWFQAPGIVEALRTGAHHELLGNRDVFLDGLYWQVIPQIRERFPDAKFIWLRRDKEAWIRSRMVHVLSVRCGVESDPRDQWIDVNTVASAAEWEEIEATIARDIQGARHVTMDVSRGDGWVKLKEITGLPAVPDVPFPRTNTGRERLEKILEVWHE